MLTPEQEILFGAYKDALIRCREVNKESDVAERAVLDAQAGASIARAEVRKAEELIYQRRCEFEASLK